MADLEGGADESCGGVEEGIGRFPSGNGGQRLLLTAAACDATNWQLVLAAAYNEQATLHSRRESQQLNS